MVLRQLLFDVLKKEDDYIEIPMIIKNVRLTKQFFHLLLLFLSCKLA